MRKITAIICITLFCAVMIAICYKAGQPHQELLSPEAQMDDTLLLDHSRIPLLVIADTCSWSDSWMMKSTQYAGKRVIDWDVDTKHFGRIEHIYDSLGAIKGLIEEAREDGSRFHELYDLIDTLRAQLATMHTTGKCPLGMDWHNEIKTTEFTTTAGCYTAKEFSALFDTANRPRLEITATVSKTQNKDKQ